MALWQMRTTAIVLMLMTHLTASPDDATSKDEEDFTSFVQVVHLTSQRNLHTHSETASPQSLQAPHSIGNVFSNSAKAASSTGIPSGARGAHGSIILITPYTLRILAKVAVLILAFIALYLGAAWHYSRGYVKEQDAKATGKTSSTTERAAVANIGADSRSRSLTRQLLSKFGLHACLSGFGKLVNKNNRQQQSPKTSSEGAPDALLSLPDLIPAVVCMDSDHPNFSGTWNCVGVEGDAERLLQDLGLGYYERSLATAVGFGAGKVTRVYSHKGSHVVFKESGLLIREQEWDISGEEQKLKDQLVKPYWELPHVLVIEAMDAEKAKPENWSTTRQYFVNEDAFVLDVSSQSGRIARWVWQRETPVSSTPRLPSSGEPTNVDVAQCLSNDPAKPSDH